MARKNKVIVDGSKVKLVRPDEEAQVLRIKKGKRQLKFMPEATDQPLPKRKVRVVLPSYLKR